MIPATNPKTVVKETATKTMAIRTMRLPPTFSACQSIFTLWEVYKDVATDCKRKALDPSESLGKRITYKKLIGCDNDGLPESRAWRA